MNQLKIVAIVAASLDGRIALHANHFTDWTSPEDKTNMRDLLDRSDVVVVGHNTYKTAQGPLSKRNCIVFTRSVAATEQRASNLLLCNPSAVDVRALLGQYQTVAVLGGTQTYTYFLDHDLLDEIYLTVEPLVFGRGLNIFESKGDKQARYQLLSVKELNQVGSVLLHYGRL